MMKKVIFLMFLSLPVFVFGQRYDNSISVQAKFGIMKGEGQYLKDLASTGQVGVQYFFGGKGYFLEANALMQDFTIDYEEIKQKIPYQLYGLNAMFGWSFEDFNPFFLNVKVGGFAGYYTANKGIDKEMMYNTTFVNEVRGVTYGGVASAEAEIVIWKKLTGVVSFSQYFYPMDKWIRWQYGLEAGFKWYF